MTGITGYGDSFRKKAEAEEHLLGGTPPIFFRFDLCKILIAWELVDSDLAFSAQNPANRGLRDQNIDFKELS